MRWLALYFPYLPLELDGFDKDCPRVMLDSRQRVVLANTAAQSEGIKPGQALATAQALAPPLSLCRENPLQLQQVMAQLALWAGQFSARISLCPPQTLLLEIASMLRYFKGSESLRQQLVVALEGQGYSCWMAMGESAQGALLLARAGGCEAISGDDYRRALGQLRIDQLELSSTQQKQLTGVGIKKLSALAGLPRIELARRLGPELTAWLDRVLGRCQQPPAPWEPPERFDLSLDLEIELEHTHAILFPLRRLLAALEGFLNQRQWLATELKLRLAGRENQQAITVVHAQGCSSASLWQDLLRLRLERETLTAPINRIALELCHHHALQADNRDLFTEQREQLSASTLISRLRSRLGDEALMRLDQLQGEPLLRPDCQPDWPQIRPSWILPTPKALPDRERRQLELLSGPERIQGSWWQQPQQRDYFIASWPDGRIGWIFRDFHDHWYLHGWFG